MNVNIANDYTQKAGETTQVHGGLNRINEKNSVSYANASRAYCVEMNGSDRNQSAYADHQKTKEEMMQEASLQDVEIQKDYMTVMSNSMSKEDYAALEKDGFKVEQMDPKKAVTIVDEIKATMAEAGVVINGYNDSMNSEKLLEIAGSPVRAQAIENAFEEQKIPMTEKNVEDTLAVMDMTGQEKPLSEGTVKYLLENELKLTVENVYMASHSGAVNANVQGQGYFAESMQGYYGRKALSSETEELLVQVDRIIREAGLDITQETRRDAMWMVENGVTLTSDSMQRMQQIHQITLPLTEKAAAEAAARAISDGMDARKSDLSCTDMMLEQAVQCRDTVAQITDEALEYVVQQDLPCTIRNLTRAKEAVSKGQSTIDQEESTALLKARRLLEEVRLSMTVASNYRMLKSGISIDTTELSELVEDLKEEEKQRNAILFDGEDEETNQERAKLYEATRTAVLAMPGLPVSILGTLLQQNYSMETLVDTGLQLQAKQEAAGVSYETMMTEPRGDLGDSIQKAFRSVDELLDAMNLASSEDNRRAVRILGYNHMEVTTQNVSEVKQTYARVHNVIDKMTPAATLDLIREGSNPLELSMEELEKRLDAKEQTTEASIEKYSKYLVKLEENQEITQQEKESYIGIYRMLHQIEKKDSAAIGSLMSQGAKISFKNLLSAVRSAKQTGMDIKVDDSVGELDEMITTAQSITEQIMSAFEPGEAMKKQEKESIASIREQCVQSDEIVAFTLQNQITPSIENLVATDSLRNHRGDLLNKVRKAEQQRRQNTEITSAKVTDSEDQIDLALNEVIENFTEENSAQSAYQKMSETMGQVLQEAAFYSSTSIDIREISLAMKQLHVAGDLVREENYEIPIQIGEEATSISVKILHDRTSGGSVSITMENETYGKLGASFEAREELLSGYVVSDSLEGLKRAKEGKDIFLSRLAERGIMTENIIFIYSESLSINNFAGKTDDNSKSLSTRNLYETAKAFIQVMSEQ